MLRYLDPSHLPLLQHISIISSPLSLFCCSTLAEALKHHTSLCSIRLGSNLMNDSGGSSLFTHLQLQHQEQQIEGEKGGGEEEETEVQGKTVPTKTEISCREKSSEISISTSCQRGSLAQLRELHVHDNELGDRTCYKLVSLLRNSSFGQQVWVFLLLSFRSL